MAAERETTRRRVRMTGQERREQLISIARPLFADRGFEGTSVEEIAARAQVSKPVVYEHFGGKEGLYAVVVDREVRTLLESIRSSLKHPGSQRDLIEYATVALLDYVENHTDGFRILVRDSNVGQTSGSFASILSDVASQVTDLLVREFKTRKLDAKAAPIYAQMLVGMVGLTGQWWLDNRKQSKQAVAAHLVNLAWNGLRHLEPKPGLRAKHDK
ncbi:TetR family transcriptional regulator [Propionibacteriaceae bacterium ES.041]|nr:TetR family transcriptional regulator [Propionibacteriaceae bacterium ES.041]TDO86410.1 TetR family transcriptional regulator [Enemella evansiae]